MSLIKQHLLEQQRQKAAIEEARLELLEEKLTLELLEYVMFGSLSPVNNDYHQHSKETTQSKKAET